ncbi:DTW domain containing protein [Novymonas esmeraldas]|uniref:tRNA-uridine aminocarboxypropyltransferase n=1 Tax=Novymonas esmeraldas TaxID=1808958 RepID=A0AAW0F4U4_9TRYP
MCAATAAAHAPLSESLVSSCGAATNPYKQSMLRLLQCVGLQHYGTPRATMPPRTRAESDRIALHVEEVRERVARHQESVRRRNIRISKRKPTSDMMRLMQCTATAATTTTASAAAAVAGGADTADAAEITAQTDELPTIYVSFEDSVEWKAFLASVAPADRHAVTVHRRLSVELWRAHQRRLCLWCWFPSNMCMCAELDAYRATLPADVLDQHVEVTMLLHSEELMRSTNSGHIAAYLLGAPLRVWGLAEDDAYLRQLPPVETRSLSGSAEAMVNVHHVSLYPSSDAVTIHDYIHRERLHRGAGGAAAGAGDGDVCSGHPALDVNRSGGVGGTELPRAMAPSNENGGGGGGGGGEAALQRAGQQKVHLVLLDSTWGQALSLNRHITRHIPRVALDIAEEYDSLFQALRKRTRGAGVSTLEATSMAVEQCVRAMGYPSEADATSQALTDAMKQFVDSRCILKYAEAQFSVDGDALDEYRERRDEARRKDAARRQDELAVQMQSDKAARRLRLPPVLNYCYCCDCVIGWHRVAEHVMGRTHRTALEANPHCFPSAASRTVIVADFTRPHRGGGEETPDTPAQDVAMDAGEHDSR